MKLTKLLTSSLIGGLIFTGVAYQPVSAQRCRDSFTLSSGQQFTRGQAWYTCSGYKFILQDDGNLVLYNRRGRAIWAVDPDRRGDTLIMQDDGNMVLYRRGRALWATDTNGHRGAHFTIQDDGNLVVYSRSGRVLWASHTAGR